MKPINLNPQESTLLEGVDYDVIPAPLKDYSESVYGDKLYSMYTIEVTTEGSDINVNILTSDLVKHTGIGGSPGYWVGVAINNKLMDGANVYTGLGVCIDSEAIKKNPLNISSEPVKSGGNQYTPIYFNAEEVMTRGNECYLLVEKEGVYYHYNINMSRVKILSESVQLEELIWKELTVQEVKDNYLFGIDLSDPQGNPLPDGLFIHYINAAVEYLQNLLDITIAESQHIAENHDYFRSDYQNWGFIQLDHSPVIEVTGLRLMHGGRPAYNIPVDWIKLDSLTGQIMLFPQSGSAGGLLIGNSGLMGGISSYWDFAPALWEVDYKAGIDKSSKNLPLSLLKEAVAKRASCGILNVWGDLIIGAGIASQSVSIDGISQSVGTTQSAMFGGASARVNEYTKDINETLLPALRMKLGGIRMVVV